jgi:predicted ATPase/class 3 adenylate cyclase
MATRVKRGPPASARPTGTVTFLFSDIEGSTQRWDRDRAAMQDALRRHDTLMRTAIAQHNGYVFKTIGDAFCAAFARPEDAVAAILDAQRALAEEDFSLVDGLRVRAAVHTGTADERDGDYYGPALNRVARLLAIGHGGQVLVSGVTRDLAHSDLPAGASLVDLGSHRLKDLTEAAHVWQLTIEGLPAEFPALKSLDTIPNNLPIARTSFIGREQDITEVKDLVEHHRLLTLVGSGGVGKTRLAIQVGAELLDRYPDGAWFVDLAPISDPELVASVVAQAIGMSQQQGRRVDEAIPQWLRRKKLLLIIDNCEHVLEPVAALADAILALAQDVHILTTSRQGLDISGEAVHRVPALAVPAETAGLRADETMRYGAVALFVDRAHAADTRFVLTNDTAPIVADICRRLDGIALAIELAAARVKVLSIPNLAQRLNERFKLLTGGSRDVLSRQKTLTALIDWSYDLLTAQEQLLFARLGVFAGGFGLDAATAVCGGGLDELDVLDLLSSLTDKSLVVADTSGERERYSLLESMAAYALEKLDVSGGRERLARRHAEYFRDQLEAARTDAIVNDERLGSRATETWLAGAELELDNYRAALEWALTQDNDAMLGGAIAGALHGLWHFASLIVEGRYWVELALPRVSEAEQPAIAARLQLALAALLVGKRAYDAAERAMQLYESVGDLRGAAAAQRQRGHALWLMGRLDEAREAIAQALAAYRATSGDTGGTRFTAACLAELAGIEAARGDLRAGRELHAQALAGFKALGDELGAADVLALMAELEFAAGDPAQALRLINESMELQSLAKNRVNTAIFHSNSAAYHIALGDLERARESAREGLRRARQLQAEGFLSSVLQHLALLAALGGDPRCGAQLLGYVDAQYEQLGTKRQRTDQWAYDKLLAALRESLSEAEIEKLAAEGAEWSEDRAVDEALKV